MAWRSESRVLAGANRKLGWGVMGEILLDHLSTKQELQGNKTKRSASPLLIKTDVGQVSCRLPLNHGTG